MERHVDVLGILIGLWGALAILLGLSLLLLSGAALAVLLGPEGGAVGFAAGLTAGTFATLGAFGLAWGAVHARASVLLRRRHPTGRLLTLALAVVNLVILPFGTALGIYGLWVLLTLEGRRLFTPSPGALAR